MAHSPGMRTMSPRRHLLCAIATVAAVGCVATAASASAPPVGPLPPGPVSDITAEQGTLVAMALPSRPASTGLVWRGARPVDPTVLRALWEAEAGGSVVVVYRAVSLGTVDVFYALTRGETVTALETRRFRVTVVAPRCSAQPQVAARYVIPPPPFAARVVSVRQTAVPAGEPTGGGQQLKRLYRVTFDVVKGNAVLESGRRFTQFAYVSRKLAAAPWCYLKGGSGP
jgi:hypothetical protein